MLTRRHCERSDAIQGPWVSAWIASSLRSSQGRVNTHGGWYYLVLADGIEIVRVLHGARDLDAIYHADN
jgi:hypothetical protein